MKIRGEIPAPSGVIVFSKKSQKGVVIIAIVGESTAGLKALHPKKFPHIDGGRGNDDQIRSGWTAEPASGNDG